MLYVYCARGSVGARDLAASLGGMRLRRFDGMTFYRKGKPIRLKEGDRVVCWGDSLPEIEGIKILNGAEIDNKYDSANRLVMAGLPTITQMEPKKDFARYLMSNPAAHPPGGFPQGTLLYGGYVLVPRRFNHIGGNDLLNPVSPNFYVKWENVTEEFRIHSFKGKSIRAGIKIPRDGFCLRVEKGYRCTRCGRHSGKDIDENIIPHGPHKWIRSFDAGYRINYDSFKSTPTLKALAAKAVKTLKLDFGAVDIGHKADGSYIIFEVNRAPGIEGGSLDAYTRHIQAWSEKPDAPDEKEDSKNGR